MNSWIHLLILSLATWRLSSLIVNEKGPFGVFLSARKLAGIIHDEDGKPLQVPERFFAELVSCIWCTSVWIGMFWAAFYFLSPTLAVAIALPFCLSAMAIFFNKNIVT